MDTFLIRKYSERTIRLITEQAISFTMTVGQLTIPSLAVAVAAASIYNQALTILCWYALDFSLYGLIHAKLYSQANTYQRQPTKAMLLRGARDVSQSVITFSGLQLFNYALIHSSLAGQIPAALLIFILKTGVEFAYEYVDHKQAEKGCWKNAYQENNGFLAALNPTDPRRIEDEVRVALGVKPQST